MRSNRKVIFQSGHHLLALSWALYSMFGITFSFRKTYSRFYR